jgi:outer membrane biosynthesis protein TonB
MISTETMGSTGLDRMRSVSGISAGQDFGISKNEENQSAVITKLSTQPSTESQPPVTSPRRTTKIIKKKKIIRKVPKKKEPTVTQESVQEPTTTPIQPTPVPAATQPKEQPVPITQPRESKGGEQEAEAAIDPFMKEILSSRAIPKSVKKKIKEECWSLFNDPKTPRGVKQCILDNMVAKARQE